MQSKIHPRYESVSFKVEIFPMQRCIGKALARDVSCSALQVRDGASERLRIVLTNWSAGEPTT